MPFLKSFLQNIELNDALNIEDKSKFRDVVFTNQRSLTNDQNLIEQEDRIIVKISLHKYLNILTQQAPYELRNMGMTNTTILSSYFGNYTLKVQQRRPLWLYLVGNRLKITRNGFERFLQTVIESNKIDLENKEIEMQDDKSQDSMEGRKNKKKPFIPEHVTSQIEKDLDRTFPHQINTVSESIKMYNETKVLLQAFYVYRPDLGYVQGMNYLATTLMSVFPLYEAFVCLCNLICG
jgi:hypothetical protein